jgi:hypothetical protein
VMGRSLAHNFARHGYRPVGYDLNPEPLHAAGIPTAASLEDLLHQLEPPRTLFLMVPAGAPVDAPARHPCAGLQKGDVITTRQSLSEHGTPLQELWPSSRIHCNRPWRAGGEIVAYGDPSLKRCTIEAWQRVAIVRRNAVPHTVWSERASVAGCAPASCRPYVKRVHSRRSNTATCSDRRGLRPAPPRRSLNQSSPRSLPLNPPASSIPYLNRDHRPVFGPRGRRTHRPTSTDRILDEGREDRRRVVDPRGTPRSSASH